MQPFYVTASREGRLAAPLKSPTLALESLTNDTNLSNLRFNLGGTFMKCR